MVVMVGGASPTLCSVEEHSFLWAGRTPVDWGSNLGPRPGSRLPQFPPFTSRSGPLPCGPAAAGGFFSFFFFFSRGFLIFFCLRVSNLLFILVRMPLMSREGDIGEEIEGRNMSVSEITAQPLWPKVDVCPSDLGGLNQ